PAKRVWLDKKLVAVREQFDMPGLGPITFYNTTKEAAQKEGIAPDLLPDLGLNVAISLKQTIERPYDTTEAVYKVTLAEPLGKVFAVDDRQKVEDNKVTVFKLVVKAIREPGKETDAPGPGKQYFQSNHFIDSANPRVKELAQKAVGDETDPWKKAKRIE